MSTVKDESPDPVRTGSGLCCILSENVLELQDHRKEQGLSRSFVNDLRVALQLRLQEALYKQLQVSI